MAMKAIKTVNMVLKYVTHPINVSIVLAELGATADIILAGMFCDVAKKGVVSLEDLSMRIISNV